MQCNGPHLNPKLKQSVTLIKVQLRSFAPSFVNFTPLDTEICTKRSSNLLKAETMSLPTGRFMPIWIHIPRTRNTTLTFPSSFLFSKLLFLPARPYKGHGTDGPAALHKKNVRSCLDKSYHSSNDFFAGFLRSRNMELRGYLLTEGLIL